MEITVEGVVLGVVDDEVGNAICKVVDAYKEENQRLRELLRKAWERLLDLEYHYTQLEDDISEALQERG